MYWMIWLVLMVAIPLLAGVSLWMELRTSPAPVVDDGLDERTVVDKR